MEKQNHQQQEKRPVGRPAMPPKIIKLDADPEQIARAIFAAAKPPDPSKRKADPQDLGN